MPVFSLFKISLPENIEKCNIITKMSNVCSAQQNKASDLNETDSRARFIKHCSTLIIESRNIKKIPKKLYNDLTASRYDGGRAKFQVVFT